MVTKEDRDREQLIGAEENIFQKYLDQVTDFAMKVLNLKKKEEPEDQKAPGGDIMAKAKDLSKNAVKSIVNTSESILKSLKLDENEQVKKLAEDAKKFLKQMGLLDEEFENEDYY